MSFSYLQKEKSCIGAFNALPRIFHCVSPEDYQILLTSKKEYEDAMLILAVCSRFFEKIKIITFQLMSNHFHFIICGDDAAIREFMDCYRKRLEFYFRRNGRMINLKTMEFKMYMIDNLEYLRSSIAYCNRNGFVVNDDITPFSYPWGANSCFFNPVMKQFYSQCRQPAKVVDLRAVFGGKKTDDIRTLYLLVNRISPFCFCDIEAGERCFRDAKQYFYYVSRNVETYHAIASIISESVSYTDDDLYYITKKLAGEKFGNSSLGVLPSHAKVELAKTLHYEYNAGAKQIQRFLKIDSSVLSSLF